MARQMAPRDRQHSQHANDVPANRPKSVLNRINTGKEINSQKYAAGGRPIGGGQGPGPMDGNPGSY